MTLHITGAQLEWHQTIRSEVYTRTDTISTILEAEVFYYKNDEITVRACIKIIEYSHQDSGQFEVLTHSYVHVHPNHSQIEISDGKILGRFNNIADAKLMAQTYFNGHHHIKTKA